MCVRGKYTLERSLKFRCLQPLSSSPSLSPFSVPLPPPPLFSRLLLPLSSAVRHPSSPSAEEEEDISRDKDGSASPESTSDSCESSRGAIIVSSPSLVEDTYGDPSSGPSCTPCSSEIPEIPEAVPAADADAAAVAVESPSSVMAVVAAAGVAAGDISVASPASSLGCCCCGCPGVVVVVVVAAESTEEMIEGARALGLPTFSTTASELQNPHVTCTTLNSPNPPTKTGCVIEYCCLALLLLLLPLLPLLSAPNSLGFPTPSCPYSSVPNA